MDLNEDAVVVILQRYFESPFPRDCPTCGRHYANLRQYVRETAPVGYSVSYDANRGDWDTANPIGSAAFANCACGNTLALTTKEMEMSQRLALLAWLKRTSEGSGRTPSEVLDQLRARIRANARGDAPAD
ncbi:MAG: hypothetical protein H6977_14160 [Gammaproteobacteria bacterium]|nr:hypothetical protein [Gammaproteobacteria bacterium]MCP5201152.1 hypothetical protein [Gammaproteobacteria bacterium]